MQSNWRIPRLCLLCCLAVSAVSEAQEPPRLVLDIQGPNARTWGLGFSRDSHRLYAGGFSKVVHVWDVGFNGPDAPPVAAPVRTLRWEISRATNGAINAMAISQVEELLVVGGDSARGDGDLTFFNTDTNEAVFTLANGASRDPHPTQQVGQGHVQAITTLEFSPDGQRLLSVDESGTAWLWRREALDRWAPANGGQPLRGAIFSAESPLGDNLRGSFLSNNVLAIPRNVDPQGSSWQLELFSRDGQRLNQNVNFSGQTKIGGLARNREGSQFAVGDYSGNVAVFDSTTFQKLREYAHRGDPVTGLALSSGGLLAVATAAQAGPGVPVKGGARIHLWDTVANAYVQGTAVGTRENVYTLQFSPDGRWLATHRDDQQEILLFAVTNAQGVREENPLAREALALRGRGKEVTRVAVVQAAAGEPLQIAFSHESDGSLTKTFLPGQGALERLAAPLPEERTVQPGTFAPGWQLRKLPVQPNAPLQELQIVDPAGAVRGTIQLNRNLAGEYRAAHVFLPGQQGQPSGVAIGTDTQAAVFVYGLDGRLQRYFRDHQGEVTSLSATLDGRFLVSSSRDQTLKIWSLEAVGQASRFRRFSEYGCDFVIEGNQLIVRNVLKSGIAFARNMRDGDRLLQLDVVQNGQIVEQTVPAEMLRSLQNLDVLQDQFTFRVVRGGEAQPARPVMFGWEPLLTLFVDTRDEWAMFTPEGYYDASPAEGHRLFGWHTNLGRGRTPRFDLAENLQKDFEKPEIIRQLFQQGNVTAALNAAGQPVPANFTQQLASSIQNTPQVKIIEPRQSFQPAAGQNEVQARVQVDLPAGLPAEQVDVKVFSAGRAVPTQFDPATGQATARVPVDQPLTALEATVTEKGKPIQHATQQRDQLSVRGNPTPEKVRAEEVHVHFLLVACDTFPKVKDLNLNFPTKDCQAIHQSFASALTEEQLFHKVHKRELYNDQVSVAAVRREVAAIRKQIQSPQDRVVVMFSGHGTRVEENGVNRFYFLRTSIEGVDHSAVVGGGKASKANPAVIANSIAWNEITQEISDLPCHVVWFVDACHSGAGAEEMKSLVRQANHPTQRFVLVSCQANESSFEDEDYGLFTKVLLQGLGGAADRPAQISGKSPGDGVVTTEELQKYVAEESQIALEELRFKASVTGKQTPFAIPTAEAPHAARVTELGLLRVPAAQPAGATSAR